MPAVCLRATLAELLSEAARIRRTFPAIETDVSEPIRGKRVGREQAAPARRGRRTTMTGAERRAVSARMKAYWGARREAKATQPVSRDSATEAVSKPAGKRATRKGSSKQR